MWRVCGVAAGSRPRGQFPEEAAVPKVFPLGANRKPAGAAAIVSKDEFHRNFMDVFCEGLLKCAFGGALCVGGSGLLLAGGDPLVTL